jgi:putative transcriptional regulator
MKTKNELRDVLRGKTAPGRVFSIARQADGRMVRKKVNVESYRKKREQEWDKRQATEARASLGLSQNAFARLLGVSVDTLQNWEQGRRKPAGAARVLLRIAAKHPEAVLEAA